MQIIGNSKIYFPLLIYFYHHIDALRCVAARIRKFVLDFKGEFADSNESKSAQIKLQRLFFRKPGFFSQRHKVKRINFGEIPCQSKI